MNVEVRALRECTNYNKSKDVFSCIVFMDLVIAEDFKDAYCELDEANTRRNIIHYILYDELIDSGTRIMIEEREVYSKIFTFDKSKDCKFDDSFCGPIDEVDFSSMIDKEIWGYIMGEYFLNGRLSKELDGFGIISIY